MATAREQVRGEIVSQMQAYGKFLQEHAEDIVGKLDETYLYESGITVSFDISDTEAPQVRVEARYLPMEASRL